MSLDTREPIYKGLTNAELKTFESYQPPKINGNFRGKSLVEFAQLDPKSIDVLFRSADFYRYAFDHSLPVPVMAGKNAAVILFEQSTRTDFSTDFGIQQLGGSTKVVYDPEGNTSLGKGETFNDSVLAWRVNCDLIAMRTKVKGAPKLAAFISENAFNHYTQPVPIVNLGDGTGEHPTQALLDLYTIRRMFHRLDGLNVVFGGDLKNGRTVHSLLEGLALYPNNFVSLLSPEELRLDDEHLVHLRDRGLRIAEISSFDEVPGDSNIWYWTRIQHERMNGKTPEEIAALRDKFVITPDVMQKYAGKKTAIMHPLPSTGELHPELRLDPRAIYLTSQIRSGPYVRAALAAHITGVDRYIPDPYENFFIENASGAKSDEEK